MIVLQKMEKFKPITIKLIQEEAKEKNDKGEVVVSKDPQGNTNYLRNDLVGLQRLLSRFDTRIHTVKDWKLSIKIKEKITKAYLDDLKEIDLNLDQAAFLKIYLKEFPEKEGKNENLLEYELRTLFGILEQIDE